MRRNKTNESRPVNNNNKKPEGVTLEEVRRLKFFQHLTDEQVLNLLKTIRSFTEIVYGIYSRGKRGKLAKESSKTTNNKNNQAEIIHLHKEPPKNKAA